MTCKDLPHCLSDVITYSLYYSLCLSYAIFHAALWGMFKHILGLRPMRFFFSLPKILPDINIDIFVLVSSLHLNSFSQYCIPWPAYLRIQHIPLEMSYYSTFFGLISLNLTTTCPIIWVMYYFFFFFVSWPLYQGSGDFVFFCLTFSPHCLKEFLPCSRPQEILVEGKNKVKEWVMGSRQKWRWGGRRETCSVT